MSLSDLTRRRLLMTTAAAAAPLALSACNKPAAQQGPAGTAASARNADLARELDAMAEALLKEFPENATFRGVDKGERAALKHRLSDKSDAAREARAQTARGRLEALRRIDRARLPAEDLPAFDSAVYAHELALEGSAFAYGNVDVLSAINSYITAPYSVTQQWGNVTQIPDFLKTLHVIDTGADAEAYLDRLSDYARGIDQETDRLNADAARGVIQPEFTLSNIIGQLEAALGQPVERWGFVTALGEKTAEKALSGDWTTRASKLATAMVGPAMQRQLDALKAQAPKATSDAGVWKLPQGEEYYAWALKVGTTTTQTPEQIHAIGLQKVAEIESRMDRLLKAQGLTRGTAGERVTAMGKDPKFLFPDTDKGREDLLAYLNGRIAAVRPRMPELFRTLPKADLVIQRVPEATQDGAPGGYEIDGSLDGTRPAHYYINLKDTANWPRFLLPTLTYHEGIPGHVWQGAFANHLPLIRSLLQFNAYTEGWALYSEQMADEIGLYQDDPFGQIGYLSDQMLRACRLVVDTGIHAMRWTREQSTAFMVRYTGQPADGVQGETDRYCTMPGQACGYMTGRLEINRLRDRARKAMGARFDIRDFNDQMVLCGSVPLAALAGVTDRYIGAR
ncbi:MAG: DUF885 family protein [Caulobacteraceae bacterium]|nr:DUF885 family protein [Caulobacteraceae bacterium]